MFFCFVVQTASEAWFANLEPEQPLAVISWNNWTNASAILCFLIRDKNAHDQVVDLILGGDFYHKTYFEFY